MCTTASGMIENMLVMIEELGFIPNGARIYYLNRSQPPMFAMMIQRYVKECIRAEEEKKEYINRVLPMMEKEYNFWMKKRSAEIFWNGKNHTLNVYRAEHWMPRPESFSEDMNAASDKSFDTDLKKQLLFQNIASAAESGWDFTERWFDYSSQFSSIRTVMLVPTDLNAIMHKNEIIMNQFFTTIGNNDKAYDYAKKAKERLDSLNELLYVNGSWMDFDLESMAPARNRNFISDIFPLLFIDSIEINKVAAALQKVENLLFKYPGGIPANEHISGQQWDFPNVWAPIQQLSIQLFLRLDNSEHGENYTKALNIAQRWINSTFCGYEMFSKILKIVIMIYK
jgi:alpha,alpha-trehalase